MGYSPEGFTTRDGKKYHVVLHELRRVGLWSADETRMVLDMDIDQVEALAQQLQTLVDICEEG